jgi:molybdenum cofactor cytidylyltransferase
VHVLRNPDYRLGQLSSLQVALRFLEDHNTEAVLVCLVDHPAMTKPVVRTLLQRFRATAAPILIPTHQGRRGHPVLFSRRVFQELLEAPLQEGARFVVRRHEREVEFVETDDEGILLDIDRPDDYESLQKRWESLTAAGGKPPQEPS